MKKTQKKILWLLSTLAISFLIYACVDDNLHKMEESDKLVFGKNKELTKEMAEQWFLAYNTPVVELRSAEIDDGVRTKPNWSRAKESRKKRYEVVETPLLSKDNIRFLDEDTKNRMDRSTDNKYIRNTTRMVVIKDLQNGKICSFFMIFVGTYDYLKRTKNMGKNSYFQRESDFEGKVLFYSPKGGLINGWRYENGKITGRISAGNSQNTISLRGGYLDCWDDSYFVETEYCVTTGYMDNELGYVETGEECVPNGGYYEPVQVCDWVDDGDDDDYGYVDDDYWNETPSGGDSNSQSGNLDEKTKKLVAQIKEELTRHNINVDNIKVRKGEYCTVSARVLDGAIELCQQFFNYEFRDQVSIFFHENYHLKNDKSWSSDNSIRLESPITLTNIPSNIKEYLNTYIEREYKDIWFDDALRKKEFESIYNSSITTSIIIQEPAFYQNEIDTYRKEKEMFQDVSQEYKETREYLLWYQEELLKISQQLNKK